MMSSGATPPPSPKKLNKRVRGARTLPRNDHNFREAEKGGPLGFLPLIGRTILGANWQNGAAVAR
jgi:hypothetical protein